MQTALTKGPGWLGRSGTCWSSSSRRRADSPRLAGMRAATGCSREEAELGGGVAEKVAELLLLRLVPAEPREVAGNAGKQRRPGAPAGSGELGREH
jgi:hypothetical protein